MPTKRKRNGKWAFVVKRAGLLPKPLNFTFDTEEEGDAYCARLEQLLDKGIVPPEFVAKPGALKSIGDAIRGYLASTSVSRSQQDYLSTLYALKSDERLTAVNYAWAEAWVNELKALDLAPNTIRHHVGPLACCLDWVVRKYPDIMPANPLRMLPKGYAIHAGRSDESKDRRLTDGEEARIIRVLGGEKADGKQRPLELHWRGALEFLFTLSVESAMRLREMYTLSVGQVDVGAKTIYLDKTKNGDKRQVPMTTVAIKAYKKYVKQVKDGQRGMEGFSHDHGLLFPFWDNDPGDSSLKRTTSRLSRQFGRVFDAAGCEGLRFHCLRHEATCRFYERTKMSDVKIALITGHKRMEMLKRYANLRASDLANELW
jgi:integrase